MNKQTLTKKVVNLGAWTISAMIFAYIAALLSQVAFDAGLSKIQIPFGDSILILGGVALIIATVAASAIAWAYLKNFDSNI